MCMRTFSLAILAVALLSAPVATAERIYTWTDENGVRHATNVPPVQPPEKVEIMQFKSRSLSLEEPVVQYTQPADTFAPETGTQIDIVDNHVIVPVILSYNGTEVSARLLLDTGSTNKSRKGTMRVAGGETIEAEAVMLDSVTVGPHTETNLLAGIIEHRGPDVPFDGLLGMNFLKNYQYTIDFEEQLLRWNIGD
jgi:hypothetical protein